MKSQSGEGLVPLTEDNDQGSFKPQQTMCPTLMAALAFGPWHMFG